MWKKDPKTKTYFALFPDYPQLMATANTGEKIINNVNEAIFEYFNVPRYIVKKIGNKYAPPEEDFKKLVQNKKQTIKTTLPKLAMA